MLTSAEARILVLAPTSRDWEVTARLLRSVELPVERCNGVQAAVQEIAAGAGALLLTDDILRSEGELELLAEALGGQPAWSELPVLLLARSDRPESQVAMLRALPGIVLLERPVQIRTLQSTLEAALRARKRQYEMRGQLEQIRTSHAEFEAAARAKDEFLAVLSHELRNPLAALASAVRLIERNDLKPAAAALARETLSRQVEHMTRLLDDLLDVSRITRGRLEIRKARIALGAILDAAIDTARPALELGRHELTLQVPAEPVYLEGDLTRLAQVVSNLLTNAAKYSDPETEVRVSAQVSGHTLEIIVADQGIGIPADALEQVFTMFVQLPSAAAHAGKGLGIGLALSRKIVELHGGSLHAHSAGQGAGSEFIVRLPVVQAPQGVGESSLPARPARCSPRSVLLVDDNDDALDALAHLLELEGHRVRTARDGPEALELARAELPEVAVLDIGMPAMNGYELAGCLRALQGAAPLTLIALTGWGQSADRSRAAEAGFDHHLTKPVDLQQLLALLSKAG